jgi:hypothetical protein
MWKMLELLEYLNQGYSHVLIVDGKNEFWYDNSLFPETKKINSDSLYAFKENHPMTTARDALRTTSIF